MLETGGSVRSPVEATGLVLVAIVTRLLGSGRSLTATLTEILHQFQQGVAKEGKI
ncbi:MAG TPA: hypothetical protein IGS53_05560 [Leptolyngbyaceae cyanobacterium M33_DOE_097]|nr:hypothetical protein [Leptolyngbyaceae cyanobacterium M33_DOE_097]